MNRALRAATMGVLLLSPVVLSACSAGQVTQTATQQRDKTGAQAQVGDLSQRHAQLLRIACHLVGGSYELLDGCLRGLQLACVGLGSAAADPVRGVHAAQERLDPAYVLLQLAHLGCDVPGGGYSSLILSCQDGAPR